MVDNTYDLIIIGAGPAGLTLATLCNNKNLKILIIDRESSIGGCHRVRRVNYNNEKIFTEHGPRIYLNSFVNFISILKKMNYDLFNKDTNNQIFNIIYNNLINIITFNELFIISFHYIFFIFNTNYGTDISMHDFLLNNNFF